MHFEPIATGFCFLEAPRADERGVWFSECALGGVRCLRPDGRIDEWLRSRQMIGGMVFNADGALLCSGPGGIVWLDPESGCSGRLLDAIDGEPIAGVNDMMSDGQGGLYFGTLDHQLIREGKPAGNSALYRLTPDGRLTKLSGGLTVCNGIGLSPDGRRLYHNESISGTYAYDLRPDGSAGEKIPLLQNPDCDGLAVDCEGGIWIASTGAGVITRLNPDGTVDWRTPVPGGHVTSLCFGGPDRRDLYVTTAAEGATAVVLKGGVPTSTSGAVYHARSEIPGLPVAPTRFNLPGR
jgi:sugar lactone lactonase YvrE